LAPGANDVLRFSYTLTQADLNNGSVNAVAEAATTSATAVSSDSVVTTQTPDLAITDTVTSVVDSNHDGITDAGDVIHYSVVATNTGNVTLSDVTVTDPLGGGTLASGITLLPGARDSLTASHTLTQADIHAGTSFVDTATASARSPGSGIINVGPVSDSVSTVLCYCPGTLIRTDRGEVPVEDLVIGDKVETMMGGAQPIKWIGRRSYDGRFLAGGTLTMPVCIKQGAIEENVPVRDLWVSPGHAICLDGVLIPALSLVNGVSIVQAASVDSVTYFHIEFASHEVIFAEGCPAESFIDDNYRNQFQNVAEFHALYPDHKAGWGSLCLPRIEDGFHLQAVQHRLAARAGVKISFEQNGPLRGYVDLASTQCIAGWAQNTDHPEAPVCLEIYVGGRPIGQVLANRYREDLERAGIGSGRHSFELTPPAGLTFSPNTVQVRRRLDGASLNLSLSCKTNIASRESLAA
jgi:uncharacterized repeat protein (TIGR01451 family)